MCRMFNDCRMICAKRAIACNRCRHHSWHHGLCQSPIANRQRHRHRSTWLARFRVESEHNPLINDISTLLLLLYCRNCKKELNKWNAKRIVRKWMGLRRGQRWEKRGKQNKTNKARIRHTHTPTLISFSLFFFAATQRWLTSVRLRLRSNRRHKFTISTWRWDARCVAMWDVMLSEREQK